MTLYRYKALANSGEVLSGEIDAADQLNIIFFEVILLVFLSITSTRNV